MKDTVYYQQLDVTDIDVSSYSHIVTTGDAVNKPSFTSDSSNADIYLAIIGEASTSSVCYANAVPVTDADRDYLVVLPAEGSVDDANRDNQQ